MRTYSKVVSSNREGEFCDLTPQVHQALADARIQVGRVSLFASDPSSVVFLNENESGLRADLQRTFARLSGGSIAGSASVVFPVVDGRPWLGDWQRVMAFGKGGDGQFVIQITGD
jgi:thiamine phosphate synthase YjbQ (UPF0047 family)